MKPLRMGRHPAPPCTWHPEMFDMPREGEDPVEANLRMERASVLCKTVCARLERCHEDRGKRNKGWTNGVVAGAYRRVKEPGNRRRVAA